MNKTLTLIFTSLLLFNCGSLECGEKGKDREGIYLFEYNQIGGDCGPFDDSLDRLDSNDREDLAGDDDCFISYDNWSENECRNEVEVFCRDDETRFSVIMISTQEDESAEIITGTMTIDLDYINGKNICRGTYEFTATRQ